MVVIFYCIFLYSVHIYNVTWFMFQISTSVRFLVPVLRCVTTLKEVTNAAVMRITR